MPVTHYQDTRGLDLSRPTFTEVVVKGIARGGGLYVPERIPSVELQEVLAFEDRPYHARAARVFELFGVDVDWEGVAELTHSAYGAAFDDPRIAPIEEVAADAHVLELWHGPTAAFKDMALQCMPLFFSEAVSIARLRGAPSTDHLVLVATSGDTGKAALEGFADRDHTRIAVFYPAGGVSDLQRLQMVTQEGDNVAVFGVAGDFDSCQSAVKAAFADASFEAMLLSDHGIRLSSANSINWGRLLPQIVYYVSAYADMVASGGVRPGEPMDVCVPTGNFGNILAAYYAKRMGVPIGTLMCASNENNVLTDFLATGDYDITDRELVRTPSPSMDILISSNLERLLFEVSRDVERVRDWLGELAGGRFRVDRETFGAIRETFKGDFVTNDESLETIARVFDETGYLLDPHTAVAWEVMERLRGENPVLLVATAHWGKFPESVYRALKHMPHESPLPDEAAALSAPDLLDRVSEMVPGQPVPSALSSLGSKAPRFDDVVEGAKEDVEAVLLEWLASSG